MKKDINSLTKIKDNLSDFIIDESWEITKVDALKIASAALLVAWVADVNWYTQCVYSSCSCSAC